MRRWGTIFFFGLLIVSFQNCGKSNFATEEENLELSSLSDLESTFGDDAEKVQNTPFALQASVDQISYNSCSGSWVQNKEGYFSLKLGSYNSRSGLQVSQAFYDHVNKNFKPAYPSETITLNQYKNILQKSPQNRDAFLQLAIRPRNNFLQPAFVQNGSTPIADIDYSPMGGSLTDDRFMDALVTGTPVVANYFPKAEVHKQRLLEAQLSYNRDEQMALNMRDQMRNYGLLALTFKSQLDSESEYYARRPEGAANNQAYGLGFILGFGAATSVSYPNSPLVGLNQVQEIDLTNGRATSSRWNCSRRYIVVRPTDAATYCPEESFQQTLSNRTEHEIVRRHLRSEDWKINVSRGCVVPRKVDCYTSDTINNALVPVQYDVSKECFDSTKQIADYDGRNPNGTVKVPINVCAQFVSICVKE